MAGCRRYFLVLAIFFHAYSASGQGYPQQYFRNPLNIPILLAGNFGECRPGHFHSGLDIKTQGRENLPVHAAAEGYISRIKMDKGGFGHALYITHPNGYTTLYAHLNNFIPKLQRYLRHQQYEKKRWDLDMTLQPSQFPVKKGDLIAYSGNTGGSLAPHLHFEIRDSKTEHPLNPQLFGFDIKDNIAPVVRSIAIYEQMHTPPAFLPLKKENEGGRETGTGRSYIADTLFANSPLGIGIVTDDYMNESENTITFLSAQIYLDNVLQSKIVLDNIGYDETRYINAYIDYAAKSLQQIWIQRFFKLPGNRLNNLYSFLNGNNGVIDIMDNNVHQLKIDLTDNNGNITTVKFYVSKPRSYSPAPPPLPTADEVLFYAGKENSFRRSNISFHLDDRHLYEDIFFSFKQKNVDGKLSGIFQLHNPYVPVHHYFDLKIKPDKIVPEEWKNKIVLKYSDGIMENGGKATPTDSGWYKAPVRNFGTYWLEVDTIPPTIESMQRRSGNLSKARQIAFTVGDNMTSVKTFSGQLDGKWICFEQHGDDFFYEFDEHCPGGKHTLVFTAADENGNETEFRLDFVR